jgi:hypothetical protein
MATMPTLLEGEGALGIDESLDCTGTLRPVSWREIWRAWNLRHCLVK